MIKMDGRRNTDIQKKTSERYRLLQGKQTTSWRGYVISREFKGQPSQADHNQWHSNERGNHKVGFKNHRQQEHSRQQIQRHKERIGKGHPWLFAQSEVYRNSLGKRRETYGNRVLRLLQPKTWRKNDIVHEKNEKRWPFQAVCYHRRKNIQWREIKESPINKLACRTNLGYLSYEGFISSLQI